MDPRKGNWKYKPLEGDTQVYYYGYVDVGEYFNVLNDPPLMHGATKPQKPAKFTKVLFIANFMLSDLLPRWRYDEENEELHSAWQQQVTDILRATNMVQEFVELLAGCS